MTNYYVKGAAALKIGGEEGIRTSREEQTKLNENPGSSLLSSPLLWMLDIPIESFGYDGSSAVREKSKDEE